MDDMAPLPPTAQNLSQNIPDMNAAIIQWRHHLEPEHARQRAGGGATLSSSRPNTCPTQLQVGLSSQSLLPQMSGIIIHKIHTYINNIDIIVYLGKSG